MHTSPTSPPLNGSVLVLIQFDVCEELRLDRLQQTVSARTVRLPSMKHSVPAYVRYQRPPVVEPLQTLLLESGERLEGEIKYYDYGVVSVIYQLPFSGDWASLVQLASRWVWDVDFASHVENIVRQKLQRATSSMVKPYSRWLSEDYFIFHVREVAGAPTAEELVRNNVLQIAQIVRGDRLNLSPGECTEVLHSQISYYTTDVVGMPLSFTTALLEPKLPSNSSNTPTRSFLNSVITTSSCLGFWTAFMTRWNKKRERLRDGDWPDPQPNCTPYSSTWRN